MLDLKLSTSFSGTPEKPIDSVVYAFGPKGEFLGQAPVKGGAAALQLDEKQAPDAQIFIGPAAPPGQEGAPTLDLMKQLRAYKAPLGYKPGTATYTLPAIPPERWRWWPYCPCMVQGHVVKPTFVSGAELDLPVSNARVHIVEVDELFLEYLSDANIMRIRDELRMIAGPFPHPFPPGPVEAPRPLPGLGPVLRAASLPVEARLAPMVEEIARPALDPSVAALARTTLPAELQTAAMASSAVAFKQTLADRVPLLYPYFCFWHWLFPFVITREVAVVQTGRDGHFSANVWHPCFSRLNLYFWVEYLIDGEWVTVYRPALLCNVRWGYACGADAVIRVTDGRVPGVAPAPATGLNLRVQRIGEGAFLHKIQSGDANADKGLLDQGAGVLVPFGGVLRPYAEFSHDLRAQQDDLANAGAITHYLWSYRREGETNWHAILAPVARHYTANYATFPWALSAAYPLNDTNGRFKIQPLNPPVPAGALNSDWSILDATGDLESTAFDTTTLTDTAGVLVENGNYELRLELFDRSGNRVDFGTGTPSPAILMWGVPLGSGSPPPDWIPADGNHLEVEAGHTRGFRMWVHVDNRRCTAGIDDVKVVTTSSTVVAGPCGFIDYPVGTSATIGFTAHHPDNYATYHFEVDRGSSGAVSEATINGRSGQPITLPGGVTNHWPNPDAGGHTAAAIPITDLMASMGSATACTDGRAAFAEWLYVAAMATDGTVRLSNLDAAATPKAFALNKV